MKKTLSVAAAALLLAACSSSLDPNAVRGALPAPGAVQLGSPAASSSGATALVEPGAPATNAQALGEAPSYKSEYAVTSYWTAVTVNAGVWWTLTLVDVITAFPPGSCTETACTWGPWLDKDTGNRWRLVVEKKGDAYDYVLAGQNDVTLGAFLPVISGTAYPGPDRHHGKGSLTLDFDAGDEFATGTKHDSGKLDVTYDNLTGAKITATLVNGKNGDPANPFTMNAAYAFDATIRQMQVAVENVDTAEQISIRTRWDATGAGRGDADYVGPNGELRASQCWAGQALGFAQTYDSSVVPATGDPLSCVFDPASYADVVLP